MKRWQRWQRWQSWQSGASILAIALVIGCSGSDDGGQDEVGESGEGESESDASSSESSESADTSSDAMDSSDSIESSDSDDVTDTSESDTQTDSETGDGDGDGDVPDNPCDMPWPGSAYYVSPEGTDESNDACSEQQPCATLQHAADVVSEPGAIVYVAPGEYVGFHTVYPDIRFEAMGPGVIVNEEHAWDGDPAPDNINVEGTDGVWIVGFEVLDAERAGIRVVTSTDVVVCNNVVGPNGRWGIFSGFAPRLQLVNNETFGSGIEHGIYVSNSDGPNDDPVIRHNVSHGNGRNGIQLNGDCYAGGDGMIEGALIEGNEVYGNTNKGLSIIAAPNTTIVANLIYGNGLEGAAGGIHMTNEPGCDDALASNDGVIANNTVIEPDIAAFRATDAATGNLVFNNLFLSPSGAVDEVGGNLIDYNLIADDETGVFEAGGYVPLTGGPAHDAGVDTFMGAGAWDVDLFGMLRPQGAAFDLGAVERAD